MPSDESRCLCAEEVFTGLPLRDCLKTLKLPNRMPYELLKRGTEGLFLQRCAAETYAPEAAERLFRQSLETV